MLATVGPMPGDDERWALEMKWDGLRAIAAVTRDEVAIFSRTGREVSVSYPELQSMAAGVGPRELILDGEIVALRGGRPDFEALAERMNVSSLATVRRRQAVVPVTYLIFDLLAVGGTSLLGACYRDRRARLEDLALEGPAWQTPPAFIGVPGAQIRDVSRREGLEGVMAKRLDSRYEPGRRSASWRKIKNIRRQEFVVGGWSPGAGGRTGQIGSLLVGVYQAGDLRFAGRVGTGLGAASLRVLAELLAPLRRDTPPFAGTMPAQQVRDAVWVEPRVVIEARFAQWTSAGRLRSASFAGLRADKDPAEVIREPAPGW